MQHAQTIDSWISQVQKKYPITVINDNGTIHVMTDSKPAVAALTESPPPGANIQIHLRLLCDDGRVIPFSSVKSESALSYWYGLG
jgi:hypothetical protein